MSFKRFLESEQLPLLNTHPKWFVKINKDGLPFVKCTNCKKETFDDGKISKRIACPSCENKGYVKEEFSKNLKMSENYTLAIFKNPKRFAEPDKPKFIRGVLDKKGDIYVWDGNTDYLHDEVARRMGWNLRDMVDIPFTVNVGQDIISLTYYNLNDYTKKELAEHKNRIESNENIKNYVGSKYPIAEVNEI